MTDKEQLQCIGEFIADLIRSRGGKEKQGKLFKQAQTTLDYVARPLRFQPGIVSINRNGRIGICLEITNPAGSAVIYYDPTPAIEKLLEQLEKVASEEIDAMEFEDEEEFEEVSADVHYSIVEMQSDDFIKMLLKLLYNEFENTVKSLPEIALKLDDCITQANLCSWIDDTIAREYYGFPVEDTKNSRNSNSKEAKPSFSINEFINQTLRELSKERKKQWTAVVKSSLESLNRSGLANLAWHFSQVYHVWREARRMYRESQKSQDSNRRRRWRENILVTYPELTPFDDLIERLTDSPKVAVQIYEKMLAKGVTPAPSDIALEHAARLCGVKPYQYTIRYLKSIKSKQGGNVRKVKPKQRA